MSEFDVIVVGTRCAGASMAMLLAREGYRVLGIDRAHFPSDTLSTHFLWPRTTHFLEAWGLLDRLAETGCPRIDTVTLHCGSEVLRGQSDAVEGTSAMYCPRRTVLDALLVTAAREAGADIREHAAVRHLLWDGQRVSARSPALACDAASVPGLSAKSLGCRDPAHCTGGGAFGHTGALPGCAPAARRNAVYGDDVLVPSVAPMSPMRARRAYRLGDHPQRAPVSGVD